MFFSYLLTLLYSPGVPLNKELLWHGLIHSHDLGKHNYVTGGVCVGGGEGVFNGLITGWVD